MSYWLVPPPRSLATMSSLDSYTLTSTRLLVAFSKAVRMSGSMYSDQM